MQHRDAKQRNVGLVIDHEDIQLGSAIVAGWSWLVKLGMVFSFFFFFSFDVLFFFYRAPSLIFLIHVRRYFYFCFSSHFSEKSYAPNRKKIISPPKKSQYPHTASGHRHAEVESTDFCFFSWDHTHLSHGPGQVSHLVWQSGAHLLLPSSAKTHPLRKEKRHCGLMRGVQWALAVVCHLFVVRVLTLSAVCSQAFCVVTGEASANFERPSWSRFSLDSRQQAILV